MKHIIIENTGRCVVRTFNDVEVELTQAIAQSLNAGNTILVPDIHLLDSHGERMRVSAKISSDGTQTWLVNLKTIRFMTGIRSRDGVITLNFEAEDNMELKWGRMDNMRMGLAVTMYQDGPYWCCDKCYLCVFDNNARAYRMPVANVFDDASLCTGEFGRQAPTITELVQACYTQFREAPWNADLYSSKADEFKIKTEKMFRWRANDSGFEQLNTTEDWTRLCYPVSNAVVDTMSEIITNTTDQGAVNPIFEDSDFEDVADEPETEEAR